MATCSSFREVFVNTGGINKWREITVKTGAECSVAGETLFGENVGGYAYQESNRVSTSTSNRFIYWRTNKEVLELVETSLDFNLTNNYLRFRFQNASIVGGIVIQESGGHVIVLVPTVCSVHRLDFPHPNRLQQYDHGFLQGTEHSVVSIFADASFSKFNEQENFHSYNPSGGLSNQITASSSWVGSEGEAIFTVAITDGRVMLIKLPQQGVQGTVSQHELKCSSVMQRLWTGLVPSVLRGGSDHLEATLSQVIHPLGHETLVFSVCKDHKLRIWSCKTFDCLVVNDLLQYAPDLENHKVTISGSGHMIRKSVGSTCRSLFLGIYMCFSDQSKLIVLNPVMADGSYKLLHVTTLFPSRDSLIDFCLTSSLLWSLWKNSEGDVYIESVNIDSTCSRTQPRMPVKMDVVPSSDIEVPSHVDTRQFYMEEIFYPGRFSTYTVLKALNIYKRSLDSTEMNDTSIPVQALRSEVSCVVELEIQKAASEYEMAEDEYVQLQTQQWAKFYSCCVQYQESSIKCLGFLADSNTGLVGVVKKHGLSLVRPAQTLEHLYTSPSEDCCTEDLQSFPAFVDDEPLCDDVLLVCDCLKSIRACLTDEMMYFFEQDMFHAQNPLEVAKSIATNLVTDSGGDSRDIQGQIREIGSLIESINDLVQAIECILLLLDLNEAQEQMAADEDNGAYQAEINRLFSSNDSIDLLCGSVRQILNTRFEMSRDLLLFLTLCLEMRDQAGVDYQVADRIQGDFANKSSLLVQVYYVMKWSACAIAVHPQASAVENNSRQMEVIDFIDAATYNPMQKFVGQNMTLLELFLKSEGGNKLREVLQSQNILDEDPYAFWKQGLLPVCSVIAQFLWPLNGSAVFLEFLLKHCQFLYIQEYVRLTKGWCEWNISTAKFMLAYSYLNCSEPDKAFECFLEACHGVSTEEFLVNLIHGESHDPSFHTVRYYLRVIPLFEVLQLPKHIVRLAKTAISIAEEGDEALATLWSKIFKQELEMGHNEEAYNAMLSNPDSSRRKDCLRQFLVVLCERSELQTLVELPYKDRHVDLEEEVIYILESRARSIDLVKQSYYDLLYAFHVFRGNFRKAGSVMYEYGMRLGQEVSGLRGLQKQAKCYLAALNTLRLVNANYAWIIKPVPSVQDEENEIKQTVKHTLTGEELQIPMKKQVDILELDDIEKEYMLVHARLQLLQVQPEPSHMIGPTSTADETIGLLANAGLFDSAINICKMFKLSLNPVFEGLASRCIKLSENSSNYMQGDNEYTAEAWSWLQHNTLPPNNTPKETSSTEHAWKLLRKYLECGEENLGTQYHRAVASRFFSQGFTLPNWFAASYKTLNAAELLRLYLDYDLLEDAALLVIEYIDAVMGKGKEYFGLKTFLHAGAPSIWLPYTSIDHLLIALRDSSDPGLSELYKVVTEKVDLLFETIDRVSQDNLEMTYRNTTLQFMV